MNTKDVKGRALAAAAVTGALLVPMAVFGGPALARSGAAASSQYQYGSGSSQYQYRVTICHLTGSKKHPGHTITGLVACGSRAPAPRRSPRRVHRARDAQGEPWQGAPREARREHEHRARQFARKGSQRQVTVPRERIVLDRGPALRGLVRKGGRRGHRRAARARDRRRAGQERRGERSRASRTRRLPFGLSPLRVPRTRRRRQHARPATTTAGSSQSQSRPACTRNATAAPAAAGTAGRPRCPMTRRNGYRKTPSTRQRPIGPSSASVSR